MTPRRSHDLPAAWLLAGLALLAPLGAGATPGATADAAADTAMAMAGGSEGTVFRSLTVEAENKVQIRFDRPELLIDLDPASAPGLTWGDAQDVLDRTVPDLQGPYLAASARQPSPYTARPWLEAYRSGPVVVIRSDLEDVAAWTLTIVDARGVEVHKRTGKKNPPQAIPWDGRGPDGTPVMPGLSYSFVIEATDKAGNKRRFVGDPFEVAAYRVDGDEGPEFLIGGRQWRQSTHRANGDPSAYLLETASWLNLTSGPGEPIVVRATARSLSEAEDLGRQAATDLSPLLPAGTSRVAVTTTVEPGAPEGGVLHIAQGEIVPTE
jgi:hypothetical protein